jgi:hypothetical protein
MTAMTQVTDSTGRRFRICQQRTQVTCGPAACLILWANVRGTDPIADEGGVIALSQQFAAPWTQARGANIANLVRVLAAMGITTELQRHHNTTTLKSVLFGKVQPQKPALAFLEWEGESSVVGHFVVVGSALQAFDRYTILDPAYGMQETTDLPYYLPVANDDPSLKFSGAIAVVS